MRLLWGAADGWNGAWVSAGRWLVVWPWEEWTMKMGLIDAVRTALMERWVSTHLNLGAAAGQGRIAWILAIDVGRHGRRSLLVLSAMEDEQLVVHHCCLLKKTKEMRMGWIDGSACGWRDGRLRLADGCFVRKPIAGSHSCRLEEDDGAPNPVLRRCAKNHVPAMCNL
ncbi:hypothetical protein ACLOJK_015061 [Asimina triloba]